MVLDRHWAPFTEIRALLSVPLVPLEYVVNAPSRLMDEFKNTLTTHNKLVKDNLRLQASNLLLNAQLQRLLAIEAENRYLKSLLQSAREVKTRTLIAEIIAIGTDPFTNQLVIDKGSHDGLYNGQPVLDATGVMGQVMQVGPLTSRVLLINDPRSGIAVQDSRNGIRAIALGEGYSDRLRLAYTAKTMDIRLGDTFITSGLSDHYPEGYPVGKVISLTRDPTHAFATIYLQPSAHLDSSREVLLLWYQHNA